MSQPHALYRFYGDAGQLLYVGITTDPGRRLTEHNQGKPWWPQVRGISIEWCDSREDAVLAEKRAIHIEQPQFNLQRPSLVRRNGKASKTLTHPIVWVCDECKQPILDGTGYIHVNEAIVHRVAVEQKAWEDKNTRPEGFLLISGAELLNMPRPAHWQSHHADCDPEPDSPDYWFDVHRARTHAQLLSWTAHLMGKTWLEHTDWDVLIQRMAGISA